MIYLDDKTFETEVLASDIPVVVDFYADWCGPCKMQGPVLEELEKEQSDFKICKLNIDEYSDIAIKLRISSIPTLVVFKNGAPAGKLVGLSSKADIINLVNGN